MATDDLSKLTGEWYRQWESSVSRWWDTVLDDPAFVKGMGDNLARNARTRASWEEGVDKSLEAMHLPSKKDLVRVARIASLLEDRIVALEDKVLAQADQLDRIEKETLKARVDAAEALLAVTDRLAAMDEKLDALTAAAGLPPKPSSARRAKKEG